MKKSLFLFILLVPVLAYWMGYETSNAESRKSFRERTLKECRNQWVPKGGKLMIRYGPYEDGHDWTFDAKNYEDDMRNCYIDWDKKLIVAEEYTQEFKNSLCHYGTWRKINAFDYESVEDAVDAIFAAECFKGNIRRTVKTWSW